MMSTWFGFTWAKGKRKPLLSASGSLRQPDHQRRLLPQYKNKLVVPLPARFAKSHVEMPEHPRKDATYFRVGQPRTNGISGDTSGGGRRCSSRLSDAVPGTDGEGLNGRSLVVCIGWVVEPALWYKAVWVAEVDLGSIGHQLIDSD